MKKSVDFKKIKDLAKKIRIDALEMVYRAKASHLGSALSSVDIIAVLYSCFIKHDPTNPLLKSRDRFLISKGHACTCMYGALAELGFIDKNELASYGSDGGRLMSHVSHKVPGVEFSTGSLGHALPIALGLSLAAKKKKKSWQTFVLLSDGELNEGSNWEAFLMAPQLKLDNLFVVVDYNKIQAFGKTNEVIKLEPLKKKFTSFGWELRECNGHNLKDIYSKMNRLVNSRRTRPKILLAHTIKGKGVSFMEDSLDWHYKSPNEEQLKRALSELEGK